jgi:hypothetical protein
MTSRTVRAHLFLTVVPVGLLLTPLAHGHTTVTVAAASVSINPTSGPPSTTVTVTGNGAIGYRNIDVFWDGTWIVATKADPAGNFTVSFTVPQNAVAGDHPVAINGAGLNQTMYFTVTPPPTDTPTNAPVPTNTPAPTDTPINTATPAPSDTPVPPAATNTPTRTPMPTNTPIAHKVIVFLEGVCRNLPYGTTTNALQPGTLFYDLATTLEQPPYNFEHSDFFSYSYKGGSISGSGYWLHNAYGMAVPAAQDLGVSLSIAARHTPRSLSGQAPKHDLRPSRP